MCRRAVSGGRGSARIGGRKLKADSSRLLRWWGGGAGLTLGEGIVMERRVSRVDGSYTRVWLTI